MQVRDRELKRQIKKASKKTGLPEGEIVARAVSSYLGSLDGIAALKEELRVWDILTARTMRKQGF